MVKPTHMQFRVDNATENYGIADYEYPLDTLTPGMIYKDLQAEYGRCVSKIYVDFFDESELKPAPVGWCFEKRVKYEDSNETYLQRTWATFVHIIPRKVIATPIPKAGD